MKVKQQRCVLGRHLIVNDVNNFFADQVIFFNKEKNISSNFCIIHKLTALNLTFVTKISSIIFLSLDNQQIRLWFVFQFLYVLHQWMSNYQNNISECRVGRDRLYHIAI